MHLARGMDADVDKQQLMRKCEAQTFKAKFQKFQSQSKDKMLAAQSYWQYCRQTVASNSKIHLCRISSPSKPVDTLDANDCSVSCICKRACVH